MPTEQADVSADAVSHPATHQPQTIARRCALVLIAVLVTIAGIHGTISWRSATHNAEQMLTALTRTLEFQVDTSLRSIDNLLLEAAQRIDPAQWPDPTLTPWFQSRLAAFPEIRQMVILGEDGQTNGTVLQADGIVNIPLDARDRQHFQFHRAHPADRAMNIGAPIHNRLDGQLAIPLSRSIIDGEGRFRGVVSVAFDPMFLVKALEKLLIEDAGGISVIRSDGIFLARLPDPGGSFGRSTATSALFRDFLPKSRSGIARIVSVTDGNAKLVGYATLERYPMVATVGITEKTAFAEFHQEVIWVALVVVVLSAALFWLATLSDQRENSRAHLAARLERQSHILEQQVAERTSHLQQAQAAAEQRARQLVASNADLEQFAHVAAHDLQEPLRSITSFVQLLQHRYRSQLDAEAHDFIGYAVDGARRMQQQILDLLTYSQVRTQGAEFEQVDLAILVQEVCGQLGKAISSSDAEILAAPLPVLCGDRRQLATLFQNLLDNAVKYRRPDHPPRIQIGAALEDNGEDWAFWVRDDGIGIDPQYAERIFIIFQRLHGRDQYEGTGIGLAICKRIVERHGGRIWVESALGKGATIRFILPSIPPAE